MSKLLIAAAASVGLLALGACAEPAPEEETTAEQMPGAEALPPADTTMPPAGDPTTPPVEDPPMPAEPGDPGTTPPTLPEDQVSPPAQ